MRLFHGHCDLLEELLRLNVNLYIEGSHLLRSLCLWQRDPF